MHLGGLELSRFNKRAASSVDGNEHVARVHNILLSREGGMLAATVMTSEEEGVGFVEGMSGEQKGEFSLLTASLDLELRKVCEKNVSQAVAEGE